MQVNPPIELLICDCDGVLIDSEIIAQRHLQQALAQHYPAQELAALLNSSFGLLTADILARVETHFGRPLPTGFVDAQRTIITSLVQREVQPISGVREALLAIDLPLAVASNGRSEAVRFALERCGLSERVNRGIFGVERVVHPKPAPDIYLLAAHTAAVAPQRCLVVEDSVTGATAALAAGMQVVGFLGASHIPPQQGDLLSELGVQHLITQMDELPALLRNVFQRVV
jgi:HAD superfamily hydrolase (TIGR01509 family)